MLGILAFASVVVFAIFLPDIITSIPKSLVGQAQFLLLLLAFDMALSIPMDTFGGALTAMQRFDLLNYSLIAVVVAQAVGWVIVLWCSMAGSSRSASSPSPSASWARWRG